MYPNLMAEMARKGISIAALAKLMQISERGLRNKLSGKTRISINEAFLIRELVAPKQTSDDLFLRGEESA